MLRVIGLVGNKPRGTSPLRRERYSPGELHHALLRTTPRRGFTGSLLLLAIAILLGLGSISEGWFLSQSSLRAPKVAAAQSRMGREREPEVQLAAQDVPSAEPRLRAEPIAPEASLLTSEPSMATPPTLEISGQAPPSDPSSTGSISLMPREAEQAEAAGPAWVTDSLPERRIIQQGLAGEAPPGAHTEPTGDDLVDLNAASVGTLNALGIGLVGRRVVANRPYAQTDDLLLKRILTRKDFEQIRTKVTAR
jgi:DNA uptake protein ComE-like DNA-binding protein